MDISRSEINKIMNHIKTTNSEMGHIQADVASLKTDIEWLKDNQRWSMRLSVSTLLGLIIMLIKILIGV